MKLWDVFILTFLFYYSTSWGTLIKIGKQWCKRLASSIIHERKQTERRTHLNPFFKQTLSVCSFLLLLFVRGTQVLEVAGETLKGEKCQRTRRQRRRGRARQAEMKFVLHALRHVTGVWGKEQVGEGSFWGGETGSEKRGSRVYREKWGILKMKVRVNLRKRRQTEREHSQDNEGERDKTDNRLFPPWGKCVFENQLSPEILCVI